MRELCLGKPSKPHLAEFCENGGKATAWELTGKRMPAKFFEQHTLTELETWSDHELELDGRLTVPMRCDAVTDRYLKVNWEYAYADIGAELNTTIYNP